MFKVAVLIVFLFGSLSANSDNYFDESFDAPPPPLAQCAEESFGVRAFAYCAAAAQCVYDNRKPTTTTPTPTTTTPLPTTTPVPTTTSPPTTCSSGFEYSKESRKCYKVHKETKYWQSANKTCTQEGATLAVINSDEEARVITDLKDKNKLSLYIPIGVYLDTSNVWMTVDGQTMEESGYNKRSQQAECKKQDKLYGYLHSNGTIAIFCPKLYGQDSFICEKNPQPL